MVIFKAVHSGDLGEESLRGRLNDIGGNQES